MTVSTKRVVSADSHVMEPPELWTRLQEKYGDKAPHEIDEYRGAKGRFLDTGRQVLTLGVADQSQADRGLREAGYLPEKRVEFQKAAGIEAETLYATYMLLIMQSPHVEALQGTAQLFNDWLIDFTAYDRTRLLGIGMIPMHDPEWATGELNRITRAGLRGVSVNVGAPEGASAPYRDRAYDGFWARAEEAGIPVSLHALSGRVPDPYHLHDARAKEEVFGGLLAIGFEIQGVLANDFIFGGILDRFPKLKLICSEFEIAWIPSFSTKLDQMVEKRSSRISLPNLHMKPSDYMRSRVWHGMIDDPFAAEVVSKMGVSQIMWGSDFPHVRSIGLDAQSTLSELLTSLPEADQLRITSGNVASLYNIN
jgi:predicted TIM-barrel fold metal-dependent hydrolase